MKTRVHDWLDMKTLKPAYGFQVFVDGKWLDVAENGKACIFHSTGERDKKQAKFRKMKGL